MPGPVTFIHTRTIVDPRYGAKLSGKIGKTTVGLLVANDEAPGKVDNRQDAAFGRTAQFIVGRARYDLYRESTASVIFTNREFMNQHSRAIGGDGDFAFGRTHRFFARVIATDHRDAAGVQRKGYFYDFNLRKAGRNVSYSLISNAISPDLRTDVGFVRRTDQRQTLGNISYRWWPETWLISWAPRLNHMRNYQFDGTLQEETSGVTVNFSFAKNITAEAGITRDMERFRSIDFWKTRYSAAAIIATSRRLTVTATMNAGDQIRFVTNPFLGSTTAWDIAIALRPVPRFQSDFSVAASRFRRHAQPPGRVRRQDSAVRCRPISSPSGCCVRNITEHNTLEKTVGENLLLTYRVNAGTVFYLGFDTRYRHGDQINPAPFPRTPTGGPIARSSRSCSTCLDTKVSRCHFDAEPPRRRAREHTNTKPRRLRFNRSRDQDAK